MNIAQQAAIESLTGDSLTTEEIAAITPLLEIRDDAAITAIINTNRKKIYTY